MVTRALPLLSGYQEGRPACKYLIPTTAEVFRRKTSRIPSTSLIHDDSGIKQNKNDKISHKVLLM